MAEEEDKTVKLVVFLQDSERVRFKVACAKNKTSMSQKAHDLILEWLITQENEPSSPAVKGK